MSRKNPARAAKRTKSRLQAFLLLLLGVFCAEHLTPGNFVPFMLSLWLPGIGLLVLGLIYGAVSMRV